MNNNTTHFALGDKAFTKLFAQVISFKFFPTES